MLRILTFKLIQHTDSHLNQVSMMETLFEFEILSVFAIFGVYASVLSRWLTSINVSDHRCPRENTVSFYSLM